MRETYGPSSVQPRVGLDVADIKNGWDATKSLTESQTKRAHQSDPYIDADLQVKWLVVLEVMLVIATTIPETSKEKRR